MLQPLVCSVPSLLPSRPLPHRSELHIASTLLQCSLELQENSGLHEEVVFDIVDLDYSGSSGLQDALLMFIISPVSS